jgi:hypothetical protein
MPPRRPPVSRARVPGRHRTPQPRAAGPGAHRGDPSAAERRAQREQDTAARQQQRTRQQNRQRISGGAQTAATAPVTLGRSAGKGGQHALMAEFLLFCGIVGLRAVADFVPGNQGQDTEGTTKGTITPASGQLGPLPVLAAGFVLFFVLSFMAARGGTSARVAAAAGLIVDVVLLMRSAPELEKVSGAFGNVAATSAATSTPTTQPVASSGPAPTGNG